MRSLPRSAARLLLALLLSIAGCECAVGEPELDGQTPVDTGMPMDANTSDAAQDARMDAQTDATADAADAADASDAMMDGGFVFDGSVPAASAVVFTGINLTGAQRLITADTPDLGNLANDVSSLVLADGYTLYGTTLTSFGGDLSTPIIGPMTLNDLGAFADQWDAIILRPTSEPTATVFRDVGAMPKVYPLGMFPSLGATTDLIDGMTLPAGVSLVGYDDPAFEGAARGPYVGPLTVNALPFRDAWSSLVIRASTPSDAAEGHLTFYVDANQTGQSVILTIGQYENLDNFPSTAVDYNNRITSIDGRSGLAVFGYAWADYGGNAFGPLVDDVGTVAGNDDWDSLVIQPIGAPTVVLYFQADHGSNYNTYPVINVPNLQNRINETEGVFVPTGYVIHGFSHAAYGGLTGVNGFVYTEGSTTIPGDVDNEWDSFIVRPANEPTVTLYFGATKTVPRVYPLGRYENLASAENQIRGANVPCGVRVTGYDAYNFSMPYTAVTGPTDIEAVPGLNFWSSMVIERVPGAVCP